MRSQLPDAGVYASAARREHALVSLLELSRELTFSLDLFETVDLLLFNLMGQMGCARSAIWLRAGDDESGPVLLRTHGARDGLMRAIGNACNPAIQERFNQIRSPILSWWLERSLEPHEFELLRQGEIAVIAPLVARDQLLGWLTLGKKVTGNSYSASDLQVLETALGMVATSLQNALYFKSVQETNRQLRASNERLQELDRLKTEFLNNVNHELRTPVTVVIATLECLTNDPNRDPQTQELVKRALEKSDHLKNLIEDLLTFSEARDSRLPMKLEMGDLSAALTAFAAERRPGITAGLRSFVYEIPERLPPAKFDGQRLTQILDELVDNAVKFTPPGAHILLRAAGVGEGTSERVHVTVRDDGPGIPPSRMKALFNSFEQVDGSSVRAVGGLGMGLALATQLAERMGWQLQAESKQGKGSVFTLVAPVSR